MGELFVPGQVIFLLPVGAVWFAVVIVPFWQIIKKAGMAAPLSLLMVIPLVNLTMLYVLAFSAWRVQPGMGGGIRQSEGFIP